MKSKHFQLRPASPLSGGPGPSSKWCLARGAKHSLRPHIARHSLHTPHTPHTLEKGGPKSWTSSATGPGPRTPQPAAKAGDGFRPQRPLHPGKTGDGFRPANPALSLSMSKGKGRNLGPVNPPPGGRRVGLSGTGIRVQIGPRCGASWGPVQCPRKSSFLGTDDDWNTTYTHTTTHQPVCRGWWVVSALQSTL